MEAVRAFAGLVPGFQPHDVAGPRSIQDAVGDRSDVRHYELESVAHPLDSVPRVPRVVQLMYLLVARHPATDAAAHLEAQRDAQRALERTHRVQCVARVLPRSMPPAVGPAQRAPRLAVFDLDSTLIREEVIDELARRVGAEARVAVITASAMAGGVDFEHSLRIRCRALAGAGAGAADLDAVRDAVHLSPGAAGLVRALKRINGCHTAVISGGFEPVARAVADRLGLDDVFANQLEADAEGRFTGALLGHVVTPQRKRETVLALARQHGVSLNDVLAVGDGANDLPMLRTAGLGIAFNAKDHVRQRAPHALNGDTMLDLLFVLGYTAEEIQRLSAE